jgi:hypothetical protein
MGKQEYLFPYDNYRHKCWYSIKDQALTDIVAINTEPPEYDPDYNDGADYHLDDDERFAKAISDLSHGKLKLDYE